MSLRTRAVPRLAALARAPRPAYRAPVRCMSDKFKDRDTAAEAQWVHEQEQKQLEAMIKKAGLDAVRAARYDLQVLLTKHKVGANEALINDLMNWKHGIQK